ncbi:MAG: DUF1205 domain-containing protein [Kutzneria sp.]|nr:DUF1205 domain-containing protein [Kutzneria sp.]
MRVLFVSALGTGHVFPVVPLAWALRSAGHELLVAAAGDALVVEKAGLPVVDVLPGATVSGVFEWIEEHHSELTTRLRNDEATRDLRRAAPVFAKVAEHMADGVLDIADRWRPDLVVHSQLQGAGWLVASRLGVPVVQQGFGFARTDGVNELMREHLAVTYDRLGVGGPPDCVRKIDVAPRSMIDGEPEGWSARYVPYNGGGVLPRWLSESRQNRPRVAVTFGTVAPTMNGLGALRRVVDVAAGVDAEFVLAVGEADIGVLDDLPPNVRSVGWVPLDQLLATCAAVIHHGGAGTTLTALDAGIPQLVLPDGADRYANADAVHDRGLGISATVDEVDAPLVIRLIKDETLSEAASDVRAEMRAMPTPASLVPRLVELVR